MVQSRMVGMSVWVVLLGVCAIAVNATQLRSGAGGALVAGIDASNAPAPPAAGAAKKKFKLVDSWSPVPWREIEFDAAAPSKRSGHSVTAVGKSLFVFGGCYREEVCYNDMRVYNTGRDEWSEISKLSKDNSESMSMVPSPRGRHSATPFKTSDGPKIIIFGGSANELYRNDVFLFDAKKKAWTRPIVTGTAPTPRAGHAAAFWHGRLFVTGGYTPDGYVNDLAVLDTTIMAWSAPPVTGSWPTPRAGHSLTHIAITQNLPDSARAHGPPAPPSAVGIDAPKPPAKGHGKKKKAAKSKKLKVRMSERLILFGGASDRGVLNDIYVFDAALMTWSRPAVSGLPPSPRHDHVAATHGEHLFINGGCDIRKLACYNDTIILDTASMTWRDPLHHVKLKVAIDEPQSSDPTGVMGKVKANAKKAVRTQQKKKKKSGWFSKLKKAARGLTRFSQQFDHAPDEFGAELEDENEAEDEMLEAEDEQEFEEEEEFDAEDEAAHESDEFDEFSEQSLMDEAEEEAEPITAAATTNTAAAIASAHSAGFVEQKISADSVPVSAADSVRFAQVDATASSSSAAAADKSKASHKRKKRQRHTDKSLAKNAKFEDPIKELTPRGGHSGAFIKNHFYVIGGCFLEQTCHFDFLYQHISSNPKKFKASKRKLPAKNESPVINTAPATAGGVGARLAKAKKEKDAAAHAASHPPKQVAIESAHVGTSFLEEEENAPHAVVEETEAAAAAADESAESAEADEFMSAPAPILLEGEASAHTTTTTTTAATTSTKASAAAKSDLKLKLKSKSKSKSKGGDSEAESESDELDVESASEATVNAVSMMRARQLDTKRNRIRELIRIYHQQHTARGDRDLTAEDRDARDEAEVEATMAADLHGGLELSADGELQIGASFETESKMKAVVNNKLFIPLAVIIGLVLIACLVIVLVWQFCGKDDGSSPDADSSSASAGNGKTAANPKSASTLAPPEIAIGANGRGSASLSSLKPSDIERTLLLDSRARAALAKDLAEQEAAAGSVRTPTASSTAATGTVSYDDDRKALESGQIV